MSTLNIAEHAQRQNVIDMALSFTGMMRVFSAGSNTSIAKKLESFFERLKGIRSAQSYDQLHQWFCVWFRANVQKNKKTPGAQASYGQGAKVLDVAAKVFVYYCKLPEAGTALRVLPFLHCGIDTGIMNYLKRRYPKGGITASTLDDINKRVYRALQGLVACDIEETFRGRVCPVEYDDIMWNRLNKSI